MITECSNRRQCYVFDIGILVDGNEPFSHYHGLRGLMHTDIKLNTIQSGKTLVNAEYFVGPATGSSDQRRPLIVLPVESLFFVQKFFHFYYDLSIFNNQLQLAALWFTNITGENLHALAEAAEYS